MELTQSRHLRIRHYLVGFLYRIARDIVVVERLCPVRDRMLRQHLGNTGIQLRCVAHAVRVGLEARIVSPIGPAESLG